MSQRCVKIATNFIKIFHQELGIFDLAHKNYMNLMDIVIAVSPDLCMTLLEIRNNYEAYNPGLNLPESGHLIPMGLLKSCKCRGNFL